MVVRESRGQSCARRGGSVQWHYLVARVRSREREGFQCDRPTPTLRRPPHMQTPALRTHSHMRLPASARSGSPGHVLIARLFVIS